MSAAEERVPLGAAGEDAAAPHPQQMAASEPKTIPPVGSGFFLPDEMPLCEALSSPNQGAPCFAGYDHGTSMESSATMSLSAAAPHANRRSSVAATAEPCSPGQPSPASVVDGAASNSAKQHAAASSANAPSCGDAASRELPKQRPRPVLLRNSMSLNEVLSPSWTCHEGKCEAPTSASAYIDPEAMHDEDRSNFIDGGQRISRIWE